MGELLELRPALQGGLQDEARGSNQHQLYEESAERGQPAL